MKKSWALLVLLLALVTAVTEKEQNIDLNSHHEEDCHSETEDVTDQDEDPDHLSASNSKRIKMEEEDITRKPRQLQFSRLMERFSDMWANSPFSYEAERERIEKIRAERGRRRPPKRFSNRRVETEKTDDDDEERAEVELAIQQNQKLLQIQQQQEISRQQHLLQLQQQKQLEEQLAQQQQQQQQHLRRLLALRQQQAESQQHNQWLFPNLVQGRPPLQNKRFQPKSPPVETKIEKSCCLFVFLDGSAHYFDKFLKAYTGKYQLQPENVNGHPYYSNRECTSGGKFSPHCRYIWRSGGRWVVGEGRYVGQNKGVMYTAEDGHCPSGLSGWRFLDADMHWRDKRGKISVDCDP